MLQGSATQDQLSSQQQDDTEEQRQLIKAQIRLGWSAEAVKQGVAHAKKGEYDSAISCYKKVQNALPATPVWPNPLSQLLATGHCPSHLLSLLCTNVLSVTCH